MKTATTAFALLLASTLLWSCTTTQPTSSAQPATPVASVDASASSQEAFPTIAPPVAYPTVPAYQPPEDRSGTPAKVLPRVPAVAFNSPFQGKNLGTFAIRDREFTVEYAALTGNLKDGALSWEVTIDGDSRHYAGQVWLPRAHCADILPIANIAIASWTDVIERPPAAPGKPDYWYTYYGDLTVFGSHRIYEARLAFSERKGSTFHVTWQGKCDIFADRGYETAVPFKIDTRMAFEGIATREKDEARARAQLGKLLNADDYTAETMNNGMIFFRPKAAATAADAATTK